MISGAHVLIFTRDDTANPAFFRGASLDPVPPVPLPGGRKAGLCESHQAHP